MRWYRAVALDLDGTLTTGGWPSNAVLERIAALRADGVAMVLVTGRILAQLDIECPGLADCFDMVVAENGCVLKTADWCRPLADPVDPGLLERLHSAGFAVSRGQVLLATTSAADHTALDAVEELGLDVHLVRNRGALMLLPAGISKGTGLREALTELQVSRHNTIAVGDAENDHPLLAAAGFGVAVGNAVGSLRQRADLVLAEDNGRGVAALLGGPILTGEQPVVSDRWRIVLGSDLGGRPAVLPAARTSVLVSGGSESGKSYVAGLIVEQLIAQEFATFVLDPEGDHVSLGTMRGVTVISGAELPHPAEVPAIFRPGVTCVVLDLSQLGAIERVDYADNVWKPLASFRADTGLPHWIVLDEAQALGTYREPGQIDIDGLCLVSWQPERLAETVRKRIEWHVELSTGGRTAMLTQSDRPSMPIMIAQRTTRHVRHWHKYVDSDLPPRLRFTFRADGLTGPIAANLRQFVLALGAVSPAMLRHHAHNGDFSRWLGDAYRDHLLSGLVRTAEQDLVVHGDAERTRRLLTELVNYRYLPRHETS